MIKINQYNIDECALTLMTPILFLVYFLYLKKIALAGVAQWIEHGPANQRVAGSIPS